MPTYSYTCQKCSRSFSLTRRRENRGAPASCPKCGTVRIRRLGVDKGSPLARGSVQAAKPQSTESPVGICIEGGDGGIISGGTIKGTTGSGVLFKGAGHHVLIDTKIIGKPVA